MPHSQNRHLNPKIPQEPSFDIAPSPEPVRVYYNFKKSIAGQLVSDKLGQVLTVSITKIKQFIGL